MKETKSPNPGKGEAFSQYSTESIVTESHLNDQVFPNLYRDSVDYPLHELIREKRLTDSIEYLENHGYLGDVAIFMFRYLVEGIA